MRPTLALALLTVTLVGCASTPKFQPAPPEARDGKTPIAPQNPTISQRIREQRIQDAQIAQGKLAVQGQLVR